MKSPFLKLLICFHLYDVIQHYNDYHAITTATTSLIELLFQIFIFYIMNDHCAKFDNISHITTEISRGQNPPSPGIACFKTHGSVKLNIPEFSYMEV